MIKYLVILLVLVGFFGNAYAQYVGDSDDPGLVWPPVCIGGPGMCPPYDQWIKEFFSNAISEPFDKSDNVIVGTIIEVDKPNSQSITYSIDVEFYLKNTQSFDSISATLENAVEPETFPEVLWYNSPVFEKGDLVFVYLKKMDGTYHVMPQSFAIDKHEIRGPPPSIIIQSGPDKRNFEQGQEVVISGMIRKADLYNIAKKGETLDVKITIKQNDKVTGYGVAKVDSNGSYNYKFQTAQMSPGVYDIEINFGPQTTGNRITIEPNLKYWTPLKQFNSGISYEKIECRENLVLIKKNDGKPACVTFQTGDTLVNRGWATCDDEVSHGRGHPCGPRSSGIVDFDKGSYKPVYPKFDGITEIINPEHEPLEYRATSPVIDDTYLSKNVQQWKDAWDFELQAKYEKYGDEFYLELGRLLMKNEMQYQMNNLGIVNSQEDFKVVSGMMLLSLPPHIGYSSIVYATDGHYYWLQGTTHANQVSYYKTTQLQFPDPIEVDFNTKTQGEIQRISILPKGENDLKTTPQLPVIAQPGKVEFYNETPGTLTVFLNKEGLEEFSFETTQKLSIKTNTGEVWEFSEPGSYHWEGEVPTLIDGKEYNLNTGGGILVLGDGMSDLSKEEQMEMSKTMLIASGLPISGIGQKGEENTLYISFSEAIIELLPESKQYYLERAQNLIPFDIFLKLDEPVLKQKPTSNESETKSDSLFIPPGHELGDAHEHASILVKIFGDRFDFSHPDFQIRSSWIHFEGLDGNTIHRHSKGITLGYLFDTLSLKLSSDCFVFVNGREFCTDQDYSLKFFINGEKTDDIRDYVINQGDRILVSYGNEGIDEIQQQLEELNAQEII